MIKYLIIDDESMAHDIIKRYCDLLPNFQLIQHCYDAIEALECLNNNKVDLIFLDLNMPKLKGFDFLKSLSKPPKVIVTTAYKEYALEGYELNIVDYLLKPFSFERFLKAINKIQDQNKEQSEATQRLEEEHDGGVFLRSNKKHIQVKLKDILFIEAIGNYSKVVTKQEEITVREKISDLLKTVSNNQFFQIHKSFIVAKDHINSIEGNRIFIDEYLIPVGKTFKVNLKALLK
ncbi:LytTR family two component transcriptional regulator [Tenacibaculum adriaticum]|uniref:LytTR family two component transcriptional regulator n=1 Tax=Tenacibaculum adriaticum TaxID=413713 RepID=A0A5S5DR68_9FLAO|nr:LytTR family DNA-binding domain-containing protein [Tenacibaculum adriaticum]TYP97878.1 LytTR family two component transcriptional regulator [Tenacibaculum adriaticum]